ncbi:MAG: YtxH domain-containing protein [Acidobacteriota bacterium]|jgi:gas vesicle protein|nr:YtxH domain-containing protein [Acidobacteriota bacterium]
MTERNGFVSTMFTFFTGAAIGAGFALLFAPQSGQETRRKIREAGNQLSEDARESYERLSRDAQKVVEQVKATSENTIAQVKTLINDAKSGIKGDAEVETPRPTKTTRSRSSKS